MSETKTNWTMATVSPHEAMIALISCLQSGRNAWIEVRKNGAQEFPIRIPNPALNNHLNWVMSYGLIRNADELRKKRFLNETEEDLTYNWIFAYGKPEAIEQYQKYGTITEELFTGGVGHPVRIKDANYYRKHIVSDNYDYSYWATFWKPKDGIPYMVVDDSIENVFTICYNDEPFDMKKAIEQAGQFMLNYAGKMI